jgi:hypothetical protein
MGTRSAYRCAKEMAPVTPFRLADELIENAGLKDIFKAAIKDGCAVVSARTSGDERG